MDFSRADHIHYIPTTAIAVNPWELEFKELRGWKERILSLENKVQDQQKIIEKLLRELHHLDRHSDELLKTVSEFTLR